MSSQSAIWVFRTKRFMVIAGPWGDDHNFCHVYRRDYPTAFPIGCASSLTDPGLTRKETITRALNRASQVIIEDHLRELGVMP